MTFSKELKEGTKKSHSAAENTSFVKNFLKGVVNKESYRKLVANFYFVYRALEEQLEKYKDNPVIEPIYFKDLNRVPFLEKDLQYYYGPTWREDIKPTEACQQYVNRIREIEPKLLISHHYTRYIGDLSGGQILKRIAQNALPLSEGEGLYFYDFPAIPDAKGFKIQYRNVLDTLPLDEQDHNAIIVEANYAFRLNMYMFDELEGNALKSFLKILCGLIRGKTLK